MGERILILAPLRGVTIRLFRAVFSRQISASGFTEAFTPFITANAGFNPLKDRELKGATCENGIRLTPQFIGKDPVAFAECLKKIKDAGYESADLNCGCPYPMVRNKGRGSGLLRNPSLLEKMIETGCSILGEKRFSIKTRLGVERTDELLRFVPMFNRYPLRFVTVHARTAVQMYDGECDQGALAEIIAASLNQIIPNGDIPLNAAPDKAMIGRAFIRSLAHCPDIRDLLAQYMEQSRHEVCGECHVLGRMKELLAYWKNDAKWRERWKSIKISRSIDELKMSL